MSRAAHECADHETTDGARCMDSRCSTRITWCGWCKTDLSLHERGCDVVEFRRSFT